MPEPSSSRFDVSLERLGKISGILVPIVIALVGWFYTATKDKNDTAIRDQQAKFDQTQKQYANLTALLPLLTSKDKAQFDLGVQIYTSEANANQAPADQLQGYIQALTASDPGDRALQQAAAAGLRQQAAAAAATPQTAQRCTANPDGVYLEIANSPEQLALGKALVAKLNAQQISPTAQGAERINQSPPQTQMRYYFSPANDQKLAAMKPVLEAAGVRIAQNVNLSPAYLKPGCTAPAVFELWIGAASPLN
jgi:hypothetical protein